MYKAPISCKKSVDGKRHDTALIVVTNSEKKIKIKKGKKERMKWGRVICFHFKSISVVYYTLQFLGSEVYTSISISWHLILMWSTFI